MYVRTQATKQVIGLFADAGSRKQNTKNRDTDDGGSTASIRDTTHCRCVGLAGLGIDRKTKISCFGLTKKKTHTDKRQLFTFLSVCFLASFPPAPPPLFVTGIVLDEASGGGDNDFTLLGYLLHFATSKYLFSTCNAFNRSTSDELPSASAQSRT
jgi:hypothetical protein